MKTQLKKTAPMCALALLLAACGDGDKVPDVEEISDGGLMDAGRFDAGPLDARVPEAGLRDGGLQDGS